jgi:hypothetical protein
MNKNEATAIVKEMAEEQVGFLSMSIEQLEKWIQDNKDIKDYWALNFACNALRINKEILKKYGPEPP